MDIDYNSDEITSKLFSRPNDDQDDCVLYRYSQIDIDPAVADKLHIAAVNRVCKSPIPGFSGMTVCDKQAESVRGLVSRDIDDYIEYQVKMLESSEYQGNRAKNVKFKLSMDFDAMKEILDSSWNCVAESAKPDDNCDEDNEDI